MHVQRVLAFGAVAVQAALSVPFFIAFVHKVYIEGSRFDRTHIGELLASSVYLARHTTVVIMTRGVAGSQGTLDVAEYVWAHPTIQPWGHELPLQCPSCGALSSLACTVHSKGVIVTTCRAHSCEYQREYMKDASWTLVKSGEGGRWMTRDYRHE